MKQRRREFLKTVALATPAALRGDAPAHPLVLWYRRPAEKWMEALPVGNGEVGAMVFGGVDREHIQLNLQGLWSGHANNEQNPRALEALPRIRQLLFDGRYAEAEEMAAKDLNTAKNPHFGCYQPLGDLWIEFDGEGQVTEYRRELDLDTAIARVSYKRGGARFTRELFASHPDVGLAVIIKSDRPGTLSMRIRLSREANATVIAKAPRTLVLECQPGDGAPASGAVLDCDDHGGRTRIDGNSLLVDRTDQVTMILNPQSARGVSRDDHIADHQSLFRRVTIDLGGPDRSAIPTDERLEAVRKGADDPQLAALYFQFGRYLLIASARTERLPPNLQGIWNDKLDPPWQCDYHSNINLQMNYWPAELCNLPELHESLFGFVDGLRASGRETAAKSYGCRGIVLHHTTNLWGHTAPMGSPGYATWQDGFGWLARHHWEHYEFGGDREFLERRAWPLMKEAAEFYLDFLVEHPKHGWLVPGPTSSPENTYLTADGKRATISMGPAISLEIIHDLFTNCMEAARVVGKETEFAGKLAAALQRLAPLQTGRYGQIREWPEDFEEREPGHRHLSPLFALHPGRQITPRATPELAAAARKLLDRRLAHGSGQTGWSCAWIINFAARLKDAELAHQYVVRLLRQSTGPNLFDTHPAGKSYVFQIDGNFGGCAGIAEMLLASHEGEVELLPALPKAWPSGRVTGLRARGGLTVDIEWRNGAAEHAVILAARSGSYRIRARGKAEPVTLEALAGKRHELRFR